MHVRSVWYTNKQIDLKDVLAMDRGAPLTLWTRIPEVPVTFPREGDKDA
jgi:hypothetical protein